MGWSVKEEASVKGGVDWNQILLQPGAAADPEKPPLMLRQQQPEFLKCPRCGSTNTKFCYYNNYNKSQPRYFCKSCKRHWTKGGTLRNVPVGGGRKSKGPRKSTSGPPISSSTAFAAAPQNQDCPNVPFASTTNDVDRKIIQNVTENTPSSNFSANTEYPFSSLDIFGLNSCLNLHQDYTLNLDSAAESTISSVNNLTMSSLQQWQIVGSCSDTMDLANEFNWNEIDELVICSNI